MLALVASSDEAASCTNTILRWGSRHFKKEMHMYGGTKARVCGRAEIAGMRLLNSSEVLRQGCCTKKPDKASDSACKDQSAVASQLPLDLPRPELAAGTFKEKAKKLLNT